MKAVVAFVCGVVFAAGLAISGMLQPAKVIGFLDVFGDWDPALAGVMIGAIPVHFVAWRLCRGRPSVWGGTVPATSNHVLDGRLFVGATLFGIGWALAGVCPAPAWTNVAAPSAFTLVTLASVLLGVALSFLVPARTR